MAGRKVRGLWVVWGRRSDEVVSCSACDVKNVIVIALISESEMDPSPSLMLPFSGCLHLAERSDMN